MTTEYQCSALTEDGETLELYTCGAPLLDQALDDFRHYVESNGYEWRTLSNLSMTAVDENLK